MQDEFIANCFKLFLDGRLSEEMRKKLHGANLMMFAISKLKSSGLKEAEWDKMLAGLKTFKDEHDDEYPKKVSDEQTAEECKLGNWVYNQRTHFFAGIMPKERIVKLVQFGFIF